MGSLRDDLLLEAVDSALQCLGTSVKESIFLYLLKKHHIPREEVPGRMEEFMKALHDLLGYGSKVVEKLIVNKYAEKIQIPTSVFEGKSLDEVLKGPKNRGISTAV